MKHTAGYPCHSPAVVMVFSKKKPTKHQRFNYELVKVALHNHQVYFYYNGDQKTLREQIIMREHGI